MARILMLGGCSQTPLDERGVLLRRLVDEDHRIVLVRPEGTFADGRATGLREVHCESVPESTTGLDPRRNRDKLHRLSRLFVRYSPDVFIGQGIRPAVEGLLASWLSGVPVRWGVLMAPGTTPGDRGATTQHLIQKTASMLYGLGDVAGCSRVYDDGSDASLLHCARRLVGTAGEIVALEGSGVDLDTYRPVALPDEASFLFDARLLESNGVAEYVEVARRIGAHHPSVDFRLAGWPAEGPDAVDSAALRGWIEEDVVDYLGHLDDARAVLAETSVYVAPIRRGGLPRRALEAMAMGRPVVATDLEGCREAVEPGRNGFLVEPRAVDPLARAMTHFVGEPQLRETMGAYSREMAVSRFDAVGLVDAVVESLELGSTRVSKPLLPTDVP